MTQLDSRLVRQQCTMSGRTATWKQPVHNTFMVTVKDQAGLLTNGLHSTVRARTAYQSLTCGEAPFSSVREQIVPGDCVDTFLPTPVNIFDCTAFTLGLCRKSSTSALHTTTSPP
jgi:hypothetical protein